MPDEAVSRPWLVPALLLLGILARLVPHPWNATPVMAIALFSGTYLARRWALALPLAIIALTDMALGWHATIPFTWSAFAATGLLGWWVRRRPAPGRILGAALAGSVFFFAFTNFGVWLVGGLYPPTPAGLWECYLAGLPFFRGTLAGDLVYTVALFGGYAALSGRALAPAPARP